MRSGHTWVELAFPKELGDCRNDRAYEIKCGDVKKVIRETDEKIMIDNLFPARSYKCSIQLESGEFDSTNFNIKTKDKSLDSVTFAPMDKIIYLVRQDIDLLLNPKMISEVTIADAASNLTLATMTAREAMTEGVQNLEPARNYDACLILKQAGGNCSRSHCPSMKWCRLVTTLPNLQDHKAEPTYKEMPIYAIAVVLMLMIIVAVLGFFLVLSHQDSGEIEIPAPPGQPETAPQVVQPV